MRYLRSDHSGAQANGTHPDLVDFDRVLMDSVREYVDPWRVAQRSIRERRIHPMLSRIFDGPQVVIKGVYCCLAAERVADRLGAAVVILVRHPCGVASSWKQLDYFGPYWIDALLSQELLLDEHLGAFVDHMRSSTHPLFQVGAYWGATYYVLHRLARAHPDWEWVSHEELCADPERGFRGLLQRLGVRVHDAEMEFFREHNRPREEGEDAYQIYRDASAEPGKWRNSLSLEEIREVMRGAEPFGVDELLQGPPRRASS